MTPICPSVGTYNIAHSEFQTVTTSATWSHNKFIAISVLVKVCPGLSHFRLGMWAAALQVHCSCVHGRVVRLQSGATSICRAKEKVGSKYQLQQPKVKRTFLHACVARKTKYQCWRIIGLIKETKNSCCMYKMDRSS